MPFMWAQSAEGMAAQTHSDSQGLWFGSISVLEENRKPSDESIRGNS